MGQPNFWSQFRCREGWSVKIQITGPRIIITAATSRSLLLPQTQKSLSKARKAPAISMVRFHQAKVHMKRKQHQASQKLNSFN